MPTENWINKPHIGDCREIMRSMVADGVKVQCAITSPPYWGLRDYGVTGQLGMEKTPEEYVANMVEVFRLVRELLNDDGTLWLNLGDCYSGAGGMGSFVDSKAKKGMEIIKQYSRNKPMKGLKSKDLIGIPWRVAFALQADGWYLRSDIIWHKPNPMPESVKDRPTKSHEYIFLLAKSQKYYFDNEAIKEKASIEENRPSGIIRNRLFNYNSKENNNPEAYKKSRPFGPVNKDKNSLVRKDTGNQFIDNGFRNKRSVWTVNTQPYKEAHFATFPPALITPCILAGSRPGDTVLDPFFGSGTTGEVAEKLGRKWIGIDLNHEYEKLQRKRTAQKGLAWR